MKNKLFIVVCMVFSTSTLFCQKKFPQFEVIINTFFDTYDVREDQKYTWLEFVKEKDGYFIEEYNREIDKFINKQLFWDSHKEKFKKLDFPKGENEDKEGRDYFLNRWNIIHFDLYPYYGYVNWEKDVIALYATETNLSDDELYALGRAYSNLSTNLINNNSGFADTNAMFKLSEYGLNQLSEEQLAQYRQYRHKAIEIFGRLAVKNPNYITFVGSIQNKYHNEYLTGFLDLRMYQNETEAQKELTDSLYSDFYRDMAKNYLNSCDSNAILFTNGDNDTYPLLYIQSELGFRQDVMVVNLSLLNNTNYINHFRYGKILKADSLAMILSPQTYSGKKLGFAFVNRNSTYDSLISLNTAIRLLEEYDSLTENSYYPDYRYLVSDKFKIEIDSICFIKLLLNEEYITKGDLIALDIVQSNIAKRPIYFFDNTRFKFDNNMELEGFVYKLVDTTQANSHYQLYGGINAQKTADIILRNFYISSEFEKDFHTTRTITQNYQRAFCHLAKYYADKNLSDSCRMVIDKYCTVIPNDKIKMDYSLLPMVEAAYKMDLLENRNSLVDAIITNMETEINKGGVSKEDKQILFYTQSKLYQFIDDNYEFEQRLKEINTKIMKIQED